jgi:hypothetical protein
MTSLPVCHVIKRQNRRSTILSTKKNGYDAVTTKVSAELFISGHFVLLLSVSANYKWMKETYNPSNSRE